MKSEILSGPGCRALKAKTRPKNLDVGTSDAHPPGGTPLETLKRAVIGTPLLGGSWDLVCRLISTSMGVISSYNCSYLT